MAYKCLECGHIFEAGEEIRWEETHGLDYPPYEKFCGCPLCQGSFEETVKCKACEEEFLQAELNGGCVCNKCIEEYSRDFDICYKIADTEKEEIKINALLVSLLDINEIEAILYQQLKSVEQNIDCSAYIEKDKCWFAEKLAEEVRNNENTKG